MNSISLSRCFLGYIIGAFIFQTAAMDQENVVPLDFRPIAKSFYQNPLHPALSNDQLRGCGVEPRDLSNVENYSWQEQCLQAGLGNETETYLFVQDLKSKAEEFGTKHCPNVLERQGIYYALAAHTIARAGVHDALLKSKIAYMHCSENRDLRDMAERSAMSFYALACQFESKPEATKEDFQYALQLHCVAIKVLRLPFNPLVDCVKNHNKDSLGTSSLKRVVNLLKEHSTYVVFNQLDEEYKASELGKECLLRILDIASFLRIPLSKFEYLFCGV